MARNIEWLVIDVDGTMTDGGLYYDSYGNELKKFNTKDLCWNFLCSSGWNKTDCYYGQNM